jgi:hypothetical protein
MSSVFWCYNALHVHLKTTGARGTDLPPPLFLTFCLQIYFQYIFFISLLFHLFFLILTCSCQYSCNLMLTTICMCRHYIDTNNHRGLNHLHRSHGLYTIYTNRGCIDQRNQATTSSVSGLKKIKKKFFGNWQAVIFLCNCHCEFVTTTWSNPWVIWEISSPMLKLPHWYVQEFIIHTHIIKPRSF